MILGICSDPKVLEVMRLINIFILIIKIAVPIILIFVLMLKFGKAVMSGSEDGLAKAQKSAPYNIVAAVLIFLVPTLISLVARVAFPNSEYKNCITVRTLDEIYALYDSKMEELIRKAEETENLNDYLTAYNYLVNIKDDDKKQSYKDRLDLLKTKIDEARRIADGSKSTGLGREIQLTDKAKKMCEYVLNADTTKIRLYRCDCRYNCMYPEALPGGGEATTMPGQGRGDPPYETHIAKEAITFSRYMLGAFSYEQPGAIRNANTYEFAKAFMLLFKGDFLTDYRFKLNSAGEIQFPTGTCTQCYSEVGLKEVYDSGQYKELMDSILEETKYLVLVNDNGELTETEFGGTRATNGPTFLMEDWSKQGMTYLEILRKLRTDTTNSKAKYYQTSNVYDCRNLIDDGSSTGNTKTINRNIIYLGDSRTQAYRDITSEIGLNTSKESIYAKYGTTANDNFQSHLQSAKNEINKNPNIKYAITANYGTNDAHNKRKYCAGYKSFVSSMDSRNQFYILSVTPVDDSTSRWLKNSEVVEFNNYMQNTCIPEIKEANPNKEVYFCDIYNKMPISTWMNYTSKDGEHYNTEGYKIIYNETKKCIASHQ